MFNDFTINKCSSAMNEVVDRLTEYGLTKEQIEEWLTTPLDALDYSTPLQLINSDQEDIVLALLLEMRSGFCL